MCNRVAIIKEGKIIEMADIRTLQQNNYKKFRVVAVSLDAAYFDIPGVTNLEHHNGAVRFFYKGDINAVMHKIGGMNVSDVTIEEPTLEEIFMHYYE
jgi:ABC-2 type transport system ATP-binding protein